MKASDQVGIIRSSRFFDPVWYAEAYPDTAFTDLDAAKHYGVVGAALGRDPGPEFDTAFYLGQISDGVAAGLPPLVHFHRVGRAEGLEPAPAAHTAHAVSLGEAADWLSHCLFALSTGADVDLARLPPGVWSEGDGPAEAALRLALHRLAVDADGGPAAALAVLGKAVPEGRGLRTRIAAAKVFAAAWTGAAETEPLFAAAAAEGLLSPDLLLARAAAEALGPLRKPSLEMALRIAGLAPLLPTATGAPLSPVPAPPIDTPPLVSVLLVLTADGGPLAGRLDAVRAQSWPGIEVVIVDTRAPGADPAADLVPDAEGLACVTCPAADAIGRGAALTAGLAKASGRFAMPWPAAGWVHPEAMARCVETLRGAPGALMAIGRSVSVDADLRPTRIGPDGRLTTPDPDLAVIDCDVLRRAGGAWDGEASVPEADLWQWARLRQGEAAAPVVEAGPLLWREAPADATRVRHGVTYPTGAMRLGIAIGRRGAARKRQTGPLAGLRARTLPHRKRDLLYGVDLCNGGEALMRTVAEARAMKRAGLTVALFDLGTADPLRPGRRHVPDRVLEVIEAGNLPLVPEGLSVEASLLVVRSAAALLHLPQRLPDISTRSAVIVPDSRALDAMHDPAAIVEGWQAGLSRLAGQRGTLCPADPIAARRLAEAGLVTGGTIADWGLALEVRQWRLAPVPAEGDALRIGHHGRDAALWPPTEAEIRAAYADRAPVAVRVLGGPAFSLRQGEPLATWHVDDPASVSEPRFLSSLDVFVLLPQSSAAELAVRLVSEAMGAGVPVVTDPMLEPVFGPAALYARPDTALDAARSLQADPAARRALLQRADDLIARWASPDAHKVRIATLGGAGPTGRGA